MKDTVMLWAEKVAPGEGVLAARTHGLVKSWTDIRGLVWGGSWQVVPSLNGRGHQKTDLLENTRSSVLTH